MAQIITSITIVLQSLVLIYLLKENMKIIEKVCALRIMFNSLMRIIVSMDEEEYMEFKERIYKEIEEGKFELPGIDNER